MLAWYLLGIHSDIFPIDVGINEYLMIQTTGVPPDIKVNSAVRYTGDAEKANSCFAPIVSAKYNIVDTQGSWVLYKMKSELN